jgi:hypothetical protein
VAAAAALPNELERQLHAARHFDDPRAVRRLPRCRTWLAELRRRPA